MNLKIGRMPKGTLNSIGDVPGVRVGHFSIDNDRHKTGVTVVLPCEDDIFKQKMVAAQHVLNGLLFSPLPPPGLLHARWQSGVWWDDSDT